jgi:hypothetical protein
MRIAIIQSSYVPWKGFFDLIGRCDQYVIYDGVRYVKGHWHNRNRIKAANGVQWLTVPVITKGRFEQPIDEVEIEKPWAEKHWRALELAYKRAAFFDTYAGTVKGWYEGADKQARLTEVNEIFLRGIAGLLDSRPASSGIRPIRPQAPAPNGYSGSCARPAPAITSVAPSAQAYFEESLSTVAGSSRNG